MTAPWETEEPVERVVLPKEETSSGLGQFVTGPNLAAETARQEAQPWATNGLDEAIAQARRNPVHPTQLATLLAEKEARSKTVPWETNDSKPKAMVPWDQPETTNKVPWESSTSDKLLGGTAAGLDTASPFIAPALGAVMGGPVGAGLGMIAGMAGPVVGGLSGLGSLALGQGPEAAAKQVEKYSEMLRPSNIMKMFWDDKEIHGPEYDKGMTPMNKLGEWLHIPAEKVHELTNSPALGAQTDVAVQTLAWLLGMKAAGKLSEATIKVPAREGPKKPFETSTTGSTPEEAAVSKLTQAPDNTIPYEKVSPDWTTTEGAAPPKPDVGETIPYDPIKENLYGEGTVPNEPIDAAERPLQLGLPLEPETPRPEVPKSDLTGEPVQGKLPLLDEPKPDAWKTPGEKAQEKPGFMRDANDLLDIREDKKPPVEPVRTPLGDLGLNDSSMASRKVAEPGLIHLALDSNVKTLGPYLEHIIATEQNPVVRAVAKILNRVVSEVGVDVTREGLSDPESIAGNYHHGTNRVTLNPNKGLNRGVILHEAVHAAVSSFQILHPDHPYSKAIDLLHSIVKDSGVLADRPYGLKSGLEFIAEAMGKADVMERLGKVQIGLKDRLILAKLLRERNPNILHTAFDVLRIAVSQITGVKSHSALEYALKAGSRIMDEHAMTPTDQSRGAQSVTLAVSRVGQDKLGYLNKAVDLAQKGETLKALEAGATRSDMAFDEHSIRDIIIGHLLTSNTFEEFQRNLRLEQSGDNWQTKVVDQAQALWDNKAKTLHEMEPSQYSQMGEASRKQSADLRPNTLFQSEDLPKDSNGRVLPIKADQDISMAGRIGNVAAIASQTNYGVIGGKWMKNVISNTQEIMNRGTKLYKEMAEMIKGYEKLARGEQKNVIKAAIAFDGLLNDELTSRGLQWPTRDMLLQHGLTPKEANVYESMTKALDKAYELMAAAFTKIGKEAPGKIPGYFPHFWLGSWRVVIHGMDGNPIRIKTFSNGVSARAYTMYAKQNNLDARLEVPTSTIHANDIVAALVQANEIYHGKSAIGEAVLKMLAKTDESAKRGIIKEALERDANIKGHMADEGFSEGIERLWGFNHDNKLLGAYNRHLENVARFWTDTHIAADVGVPYYEAIHNGVLQNVPNTRAAINEYLARATGGPVNHFAIVDHIARSMSIALQLPPDTVHSFGRSMSAFLSKSKLALGNLNYIVSNVFQPMTNAVDTGLTHAERVIAGEPTGNLVKANATFLTEFLKIQNGEGSKLLEAALAWAVENNKISVYQADHINPFKSTDMWAKGSDWIINKPQMFVEERGRAISFLAHYVYFKDVMPERQALHAAADKMNMAMGDYAQHASAGMYTDFGIIGQGLRPFGLLRNVYFGKLFQSLSLLSQTVKMSMSDPAKMPLIAVALAPTLAMIGSSLMIGGVGGMYGAAEYDVIARWYNATFNPDVPMKRPQELAREMGFSDSKIYGFIGNALGWDIGPSMNAPALTELGGMPGVATGKQWGILLKAVLDHYTGHNPNWSDVRNATRQLAPPWAIPIVEGQIAQAQSGGSVMPKTSSMDAGTTRSAYEDKMYRITGKRAITEVERTTIDNLNKYRTGLDMKWKQEMVSKIVDAMAGITWKTLTPGADLFFNPQTSEEKAKVISDLFKQALGGDDGKNSRGFGITTEGRNTLEEAIMAEKRRRVVSQHIRDLEGIMNNKNPAEQQNNMKQLMDLMRGNQ